MLRGLQVFNFDKIMYWPKVLNIFLWKSSCVTLRCVIVNLGLLQIYWRESEKAVFLLKLFVKYYFPVIFSLKETK